MTPRQTADTFDAAATFFDLTHEWGTPDPEVLQKIRFAKWNAARILKAIREGRDPNESNPRVEEEPQQPEPPLLSPSDPAVQAITQPGPQAASVEDVADAGEQQQLAGLDAQRSYFPSTAEPTTEEASGPSPLAQSPFAGANSSAPLPPPPSPPQPNISPLPSPEVQIPAHALNKTTSSFAPPTSPPAPQAPVPGSRPQPWTNTTDPPSISQPAPKTTPTPASVAAVPFPAARTAHAGPSVPVVPTPNPKSIEQAQKHAKWAISALNFEDIPTAVQELRNALALLGCQ